MRFHNYLQQLPEVKKEKSFCADKKKEIQIGLTVWKMKSFWYQWKKFQIKCEEDFSKKES